MTRTLAEIERELEILRRAAQAELATEVARQAALQLLIPAENLLHYMSDFVMKHDINMQARYEKLKEACIKLREQLDLPIETCQNLADLERHMI